MKTPRKSHVAFPLVILSSACVTGPYTPSATFLSRAEEVPGARAVVLPPYADAYAAWQLPAENVWSRYNKTTLLAALGEAPQVGLLPDTSALDIVRRAEEAASTLGAAGVPQDTLFMVDLRGAAAVAFGNALSHRAAAPVSLVLTFNNWPAPRELIPAEETLSALVSLRPLMPGPDDHGSRPVFLLDAWRLAYRDTQPDDQAFDNRYVLTPADVPDAGTLLSQGIRHVVYVIERRTDDTVEEDDLHEAFLAYQQAGIAIHLLDLDDLLVSGDPILLQECYVRRVFPIGFRTTLIHSPWFYRRSRGGFGGPHARPGHIGFAAGFGGPSHGGG